MRLLLIVLLLAWLAVSVIGFVFEALLWLAFLGLALFAVTLIIGVVRGRGAGKKP